MMAAPTKPWEQPQVTNVAEGDAPGLAATEAGKDLGNGHGEGVAELASAPAEPKVAAAATPGSGPAIAEQD